MHEAAHDYPLPAAGFDPEAVRADFPLLAEPERRRCVLLAWDALNAILTERSGNRGAPTSAARASTE
jgi:NifU-like protein involved in Fe-S cluster formation